MVGYYSRKRFWMWLLWIHPYRILKEYSTSIKKEPPRSTGEDLVRSTKSASKCFETNYETNLKSRPKSNSQVGPSLRSLPPVAPSFSSRIVFQVRFGSMLERPLLECLGNLPCNPKGQGAFGKLGVAENGQGSF